jgi:hypothetical protein
MVLQEKGFSVISATHGSQGAKVCGGWCRSQWMQLFCYSRVPPGLLDGAAVADEIKKIRPRLPIVMLAESLELPEGALKSVDALV